MAERKVLNKYYPPNFDPSKIPMGFVLGGGYKVRLMAPFSMRCNTCGEFIYKGTKFNARKETVRGEEYLGIEIYRFYVRCPCCAAEISFKTDPKNADYVAEHGVQRNFETWREEKIANEEISFRKQLEEEMDPMKALENKTVDSKREVDILESLDEIRTHNARSEKVDVDSALERLNERERKQQETVDEKRRREDAEDEAVAKIFFQSTAADGLRLKRLLEVDEDQPVVAAATVSGVTEKDIPNDAPVADHVHSQQAGHSIKNNNNDNNSNDSKKVRLTAKDLGIVVRKKPATTPATTLKNIGGSGLSLLSMYNDDDDDSDE